LESGVNKRKKRETKTIKKKFICRKRGGTGFRSRHSKLLSWLQALWGRGEGGEHKGTENSRQPPWPRGLRKTRSQREDAEKARRRRVILDRGNGKRKVYPIETNHNRRRGKKEKDVWDHP